MFTSTEIHLKEDILHLVSRLFHEMKTSYAVVTAQLIEGDAIENGLCLHLSIF